MSAPTPVWQQVLAGLERHVDLLSAAIRDDVPVPDAWTPDVDPGPIPASLVPRAQRLVARMRELETTADARADGLRAELDDVGRRRAAGAAYHGSGRTP